MEAWAPCQTNPVASSLPRSPWDTPGSTSFAHQLTSSKHTVQIQHLQTLPSWNQIHLQLRCQPSCGTRLAWGSERSCRVRCNQHHQVNLCFGKWVQQQENCDCNSRTPSHINVHCAVAITDFLLLNPLPSLTVNLVTEIASVLQRGCTAPCRPCTGTRMAPDPRVSERC